MNEFQELINLIEAIVRWVLTTTWCLLKTIGIFLFDFMAVAIFTVSLIPPWRLIAFLSTASGGERAKLSDIRKIAVKSFFYTLIDLMVFIFFVIASISLLRIPLLRHTLTRAAVRRQHGYKIDLNYDLSRREDILRHALLGIFDVFGLVAGVIAFCVPTMTAGVLHGDISMMMAWNAGEFADGVDDFSNFDNFLHSLRLFHFERFLISIFDCIPIFLGMTAMLF
jgi:hypothetical protein